jgi:chromosome segregation ATPase
MTIPDLIAKLRREAETRATYAGELLGEAADTIEDMDKLLQEVADQIRAVIMGKRPDDWAWPLHGLRDVLQDATQAVADHAAARSQAEARVAELERERAARLDRIEAWLRGTHGYPYPGKD